MFSTTITLAQLKTRPGNLKNATTIILGASTTGDNGSAMFYWEPTSTATPDDINIVQVTGVTTGRWLRTKNVATDAETQIVSGVTEDYKNVSRLKLFNWWTWIKAQTQSISGLWNFVTPPTISGNNIETTNNKSNSVLLGTSNLLYPTQNAVKTYVDNSLPVATTSIQGKTFMSASSADTAGTIGTIYSQVEVQSILDELRDLKVKLRNAGILDT